MRFPSTLLSIFAKHDGSQAPDDGVIDVPAALLPVVTLPKICRQFRLGGTDPANDSLVHDATGTFVNTVAQDITQVVLAAGLWDVGIAFEAVADFTALANQDFIYWVNPDDATQAAAVLSFRRIANVFNHATWYQRIALDRIMHLRVNIAATGVGQTLRYDAHFACNRLG